MMFGLVFIVMIVIYFVYHNGTFEINTRTSFSTLNERLANGDISIENYKEIKKTINEESK